MSSREQHLETLAILIGSWVIIAFSLIGDSSPRERGALLLISIGLALVLAVIVWRHGVRGLHWSDWLFVPTLLGSLWAQTTLPSGPSTLNYAALAVLLVPFFRRRQR